MDGISQDVLGISATFYNNYTINNSSTDDQKQRYSCRLTTAFVVLCILASIITGIVILGNGFILWTLKGRRQTNYDVLLIYLSTFDFLAAVTMIARIYTEVTRCSSKWPFGDLGCKILLPFYDVSINVSVCILIIISLDRCWTVLRPLQTLYKSPATIHFAVWISIVVSSAVYFERFMTAKVQNGVCGFVLDGSLLNLSPLLVWLVRDCLFLVLFTATSLIIRHSLRVTPHLPRECLERKKTQSKTVYSNLLLMQVIFSLLVLPFDILSCISLGYVMVHNKAINWKLFHVFSSYLYLLQMSNSLANCFIYSRIHHHIKASSRNNNNKALGKASFINGDLIKISLLKMVNKHALEEDPQCIPIAV